MKNNYKQNNSFRGYSNRNNNTNKKFNNTNRNYDNNGYKN